MADRGVTQEQASRKRQLTDTKDKKITSTLDASNTSEKVVLGVPATKITVQADGDLQYTVKISVNGENFESSASITTTASNEIASESTHLMYALLIERSSGSGKVTVLAE